MASKNYRYTKTGKKNPNYVKSTSSSAPATKEERRAAGRQRLWEAEKAERDKKNSLDYKKQQSSQVGWQKSISNAPNKQEQEKQRQKNREQGRMRRWEETQKDAYKYDSQFTEDYFNNSRYNSILQSDFDSLDFKSKAEHMDLVRKAQAGWNYRSQFEGVDEKVNPTTEDLYDLNSGANAVRDISWINGASEEDIRWLISDMEKRIENVGKTNKSRYRDDTQAELDAIKDYAKNNFTSFALAEKNHISAELAKLDANYINQQRTDENLLAAVGEVVRAGSTGNSVASYVANDPGLRKALGYDELAAKYPDPLDLDAELWIRANEITAGGATAQASDEQYRAYADDRTALQSDLDEAQGVYDNLLTGDNYARILQDAGMVKAGRAYSRDVQDYNAISQTEESTIGMFGETNTTRGYKENIATLDQIVDHPQRVISESAKLGANDADATYQAALAATMTPEERDTYWALRAGADGEARAAEYFDWLTRNELSRRNYEKQLAATEELARTKPVQASIASLGTNVVGAIGGAADIARGALGMETDQYGPNQMYTRKTQEIRETVGEEIAKKWEWTIPGLNVNAGVFLYNTLMSAGDMGVSLAIGGGFGGGAGTNAAKSITQLVMASEAASSAFTDAIDRGIDPQTAAFEAVGAGLIEGVTEKYSLEKLFQDVTPDNLKATLKYIGQNILAEGSEEIAADVLNDAVDVLMNTSDSELLSKYNDYVSNGYDSKGAIWRLIGETASGYAVSGAAGAVTGGVMAGGNAIAQGVEIDSRYKSEGQKIIDSGNAAAVIRAGLESTNEKARKLAQWLVSKIGEDGLKNDAETAAEIQVLNEELNTATNTYNAAAQAQASAGDAYEAARQEQQLVQEDLASAPADMSTNYRTALEQDADDAAMALDEAFNEKQTADQNAEKAAAAKEAAQKALEDAKAKGEAITNEISEVFKNKTGKLGKLYTKVMKALDVDISTKGVAEMTERIKARLKQLGEETIDPVADAIAKLVTGEKPTQEQLDLLEGNTLREGVLNEVTRSIIRNGGSEFVSDDTQNKMATRTALQGATTQKGVQLPDAKTAAAAPQDKVQAMVEETIAADKDGTIQARAQMLGNEEAAQTMIKMAEGVTNTRAYATAFEAAYDYGTAGIDQRVASTSKETTALTPEQFQAAYQAGVKAAAAPVRAAKTGGKVTFAGNLGSRLSTLDGNQRTGINALRKIASIGTVNVEFFESDIDENGNYSEKQGWYDPNTNTIHIDINAGRNNATSTANFALLKVASHELTHYIKAQNASGYKALQDFVVKQLTADGTNTFDGLVALKMKQRKGISYEVAVEEVVADGCEMMLRDSTAIQQLAQENKGLFRRIRNWLRNFIANVKRAFRGVEATSVEARMITDLEGLQKVWDDALVQASRNVQQSAAETLHMSAETQQAIENDQPVDAEAEVKHSIRLDEQFGEDAMRMNQTNGYVSAADLKRALADRKVIRDIFLDPANRDLLKLPPDIEGDTFVSDASYGGTEENTTVCIRSMAAQALMDLISQNLGRPLTVQDTLLISQEIAGLTDRPECYYCYVATDRRAYRDFLGQYLAQRDEVVKKYKAGADKDELYTEFLGSRKSTANMRARFNMWINAVDNGIPMIDGNDLASLENLFGEVDSLRGEILAAAAEVSGIEAGKLNIVNGSVRYAKAGKQITATTLNALKKSNPGMADTINRYMQLTDATAYAQSASWAKKMKGYAAYNGHILNWSQKRVGDLNKHYGLRMYSFSDFSPAFILENMQMVTDAAVRGLNMLGYTKEMPFAEIFAPSGMNINISTFAYEQGGEVKEDYKQGASWERAKALREKHPNVGIVMVAASDNILEWALKQDWVDVVIPYHLVRTGTDVAEYFGYKNYTGVSADGKGLSFAEKNKGKTKKERVTSVSPVEHRNDLISYVDALERYGLTPRFAQWLKGLEDYRAGKISPKQFRDMNPNYMKLVNETRRSYADTDPVQPKFDMGAAKEAINQMIREGGYYTPVGGSIEAEFEIAGAVADKIRDSGVRYSTRADAEIESDIRNNPPYETGAGNIRYSKRVTDRDTLRFLDGQDYVVTYRSMQVLRGKLYPPMATEIEGRMEDASEVGVWEQAVEHPELIKFDKNGKAQFKLDKGVNDEGKSNGTDVVAAYNPYMHSSNLVLNDQFSAAWDRPNLVVVECHVPVSELTSGYHAQYAKDSVGWHSWHTGTVAGKLRKAKGIERQVLLSRYIKPVRILSYAEVAQQYAELLEGTDIEVPDNVVPPKLLEELKRHDVPIVESGKVKYSIRTDSLTDREILADAFENVASNDTERSFLKNYRDKIADLQQKQAQLREINRDITKRKENAERKPNGRLVYDEELIKQQNRAKVLRAQIDREDNAIIEMIKSKPLQDVLRRQKQRIEKQEAGKRKEAIATIRDRRNATEVRHKIKAVLDDFNRRLKNPTEKSYIPANMVQMVIAAEELIDTRSGREGEKAQAKLAAIQGMYERYKSDATFAYVYDPIIGDMLNSLSSVVGNKTIYQLNTAELQSVYETLKALKKQVTEAVQLKAGNYARTIIEAGREMIRETQAAAPLAKGKAGEFLNWQLTPDKFFARLAGFKKDSVWSKVAKTFSDGTEKMLEIQRDHYYHFREFTESKEFDKLNDLKHLVDIGLKDENGNTVKVTRGMMLSAYMHLLNEENARGFMYGGFSIPNLKAYYGGKVKESYGSGSANTRGTSAELADLAEQMRNPELTEDELIELEREHEALILKGMNRLGQMRADIEAQLTQYEKDLIKAVQAWNNGKSQQYINDVTMDLYGIKKASVDNYYPIHRDTAFVNTDFASISRNMNLENWGSLKTRVPSQAPIMLTDIAFEMDNSLRQMSQYVGYARAQRDFNKLYNVRMPGMQGSVKKAVSVKFGTGAGIMGVSGEQYIENYIGSITGSRQGQDGPLSLIRRNLVRSTMTLNLRVGFSQLSAIPKAAAEVGLDSMISGFAKGGFKAIFSKSAREDLAKQNAWFWQRYRGEGGQREFADAKGGNDIISKAWNKMDDITRGKLLNWCQNFDVMSTVSMWSMAKAWARKHTNYAEGSTEFIEAANKKYTDILRNTQAMSTTTERSDASRNTGDGWNLFMMFKSEAFANFNLLYDAVAKMRKYSADFKTGANGVTRADVTAAKKHLAGAAMSVILGASLGNAILKLAINALMHAMNGYRDDEDEIEFESILTAIGKEVASDTTGMVLLGGELYEFISAAVMGDKYYAPTDMALGEVTELLETVMKVAQDEDRTAEEVLAAGKKVAFNLTNIFGVPAENGKRFVKMIQDWYDERNHDTPWYKFEGGVTRTNSVNYDRLYNAAIAGDDAKFDSVLVELAENGVEEKDAREGFRNQLKDAYEDGSITADEAMNLLVSHGDKDEDEAFWTMEKWNYSGEESYSKYADLRTALKESNASVAKAEIQKLTSHGVEEKTVISELSTMYNKGEATTIMNLQLRSNNLYTSNLKLKTDKEVHKDDFDAFLTAVVNGSGITNEVNKLYQKGYTTKQIMSALNGAFGNSGGKKYQRMVYYNPTEARTLLDRILKAYEAIGLDRNEEIAWINENWEKFVPDTDE